MRRALIIPLGTVLACSVFSESMRKHDAGDVTASDGAGGGDGSAIGDASGACSLDVPAGQGAAGCGGAGGGTYGGIAAQPPGGAPQSVPLQTAVCGQTVPQAVTRFSFALDMGCYELTFVADSATVTIHGPGGISETHVGSSTVPFRTDASGTLDVSVTASVPQPYQLLVR